MKKMCGELGIELRTAEDAERNDVEPEEQRNPRAERTIDLRVIGETSDIPSKGERGDEPHHGSDDGSGYHALPGLPHGRAHVIDNGHNGDTAGQSDNPTDEISKEVDGWTGEGHSLLCDPNGDEMAEDNKHTGKNKRDERERDEKEGSATALPKSPAVWGKIIGAADTFHQSRYNAGSSCDADDERDDECMRGLRVVGRGYKITLKQRADIGRKDAVEDSGKLEPHWRSIRKQADNCSSHNERGK